MQIVKQVKWFDDEDDNPFKPEEEPAS